MLLPPRKSDDAPTNSLDTKGGGRGGGDSKVINNQATKGAKRDVNQKSFQMYKRGWGQEIKKGKAPVGGGRPLAEAFEGEKTGVPRPRLCSNLNDKR